MSVRREPDAELQAILDAWAGLRRRGRRALNFGWTAMIGRAAVATVALGLFFFLAAFHRPPPPTYPKAKVNFAQAWDRNGNPVSRDEWTSRALQAARTAR